MAQTFAVAGPPGSGKTAWIAKQAEALAQSKPLYWSLGETGITLDGMLLATRCPKLEGIAQLTTEIVQEAIAE